MRRRHGGTGLHSPSTCGNEVMARCRELFPRCASCGNAGSVQAVALRLKINLTPLNARLHIWCPRRDSKGLRFAKPRASDARRPRHAPLQTGRRPVCLTLRALTRVRHEKGGRNPLERSLACMVPEARLELARCCQRWILSPLRLPIPPLGHVMRELVYHSFLLISPKMELRAFR